MNTQDFRDEDSMETMVLRRPGTGVEPEGSSLGHVDHYEIVRKLGAGGFGVVYLARDTASGVAVALKTLHPLLKRNAEEMGRLREKFSLVSRLSHPNIATALVLHPVRDVVLSDPAAERELGLSSGDFVMVMRYAPGVTLSQWRRQFPGGVVPLETALEIGRQIASALDCAHGEQIVHRDIKPSNVMVETLAAEPQAPDHGHGMARSPSAPKGGGGLQTAEAPQGVASRPGEPALVTRHPSPVTSRIRVRILDFGLAAEIRSSMSRVSMERGETSGTRPYMAPEQWTGRKQDGRTDQYALACVLYELVSGAPPFSGVFETGDAEVMALAVESRRPDPVPGVPDAVNAALLRALSKNPQDRFPSCTAFVGAAAGTSRKSRRRAWLPWAAAAGLAVAGVWILARSTAPRAQRSIGGSVVAECRVSPTATPAGETEMAALLTPYVPVPPAPPAPPSPPAVPSVAASAPALSSAAASAECRRCGGKGTVPCEATRGTAWLDQNEVPCELCRGSGHFHMQKGQLGPCSSRGVPWDMPCEACTRCQGVGLLFNLNRDGASPRPTASSQHVFVSAFPCPQCGGSGHFHNQKWPPAGACPLPYGKCMDFVREVCTGCKGFGFLFEACAACGGTGEMACPDCGGEPSFPGSEFFRKLLEYVSADSTKP